MATAAIAHIVKQIKQLSLPQRKELQTVLMTLFPSLRPQATEEDFRQALRMAGLLSSPAVESRTKPVRRRPLTPVPVRGKPVSETLIEERR